MYIFSYLKYVAWCNANSRTIGDWAKGCEGNPAESGRVYNSDYQFWFMVGITTEDLELWCNKL